MWCQYEHKAPAKSFFLGIYQGTSWPPRLVRLSGMFSQQNGVRTARSHAVRSLAFVLTQEIHTAGVVYISGEAARNKLFNRGAPRFFFFFFFFQSTVGSGKAGDDFCCSSHPKQLSQLRFLSDLSHSALDDPQTITSCLRSSLSSQRQTVYVRTCTRDTFFLFFNGFTVKVRQPQPLLIHFLLVESQLNGEAKLKL